MDYLEGRRRGLIESRKGKRAYEQRKCDQRKIAEIGMEWGWQKYDLHVSYVEVMNMDDCTVHASHFVETGGRTEMRIQNWGRILTTFSIDSGIVF